MLPQLLFIGVSIIALGFASRWAKMEIARVDRQMDRMQKILNSMNGEPTASLQLDPKSGVYLPVNS